MRHSEKDGSSSSQAFNLITVSDLAKHLNVKAGALYREIEEHGWREEQGIFRVLPGKRGIRVDEYQFLNWRRMPASVLGDAHVREVTRTLLAMLYPMRAAIEHAITSCARMYDESSQTVADATAADPAEVEVRPYPDGEDEA